MRNLSLASFALSIALVVILGSTQGVLGVETPLTDYSRAVILENPIYYWTFNEAGATDVAQEVMRYETEAEMMPILDTTRVASYSTELGNAASFNGNASFWAEMVNRGSMAGAYAIEYWVKADIVSGGGYIADISLGSGNSPGIIHNFSTNQTELWYGGPRTGDQSQLNFSDGQWHHVVLAVNADGVSGTLDQVDIAVDGVVTTGLTTVDALRLNLSYAIDIGACKPISATGVNDLVTGPEAGAVWDGFNGQVDEFALYDLAGMNSTEVAAKVTSLATHYSLATSPVEITPFAAVPVDEVSYSFVGGNEVSPSYPDSTGSELSDGLYSGNGTGGCVGYYGAYGGDDYTELEFDLGSVQTLESVWVNYLSGGHWGINAPEAVELSFSTDGVNFSNTITFADFNNTASPADDSFNERLSQIDVGSIEAQYVRANFDFNGVFLFLSEIEFMAQVTETPQVAGDANGDGKVDGSDVTILAGNWQKGVSDGLTASWEEGDFNGDGKVDGSDVTILAGNWQYGVSAVAASVPEPGTFILCLSMLTWFVWYRRN